MEAVGCGPNTVKAVTTWLSVGGRRIDSADSYFNEKSVGIAMKQSGVAREDLFVLSKIGSTDPMGFNTTLTQTAQILSDLQTDYVDLLLVHWPTYKPNALSGWAEPSDPFCNTTASTYDAKACRLSTWKAMVQLWKAGKAKAIGVSNYNSTHIQEIIDAGMPLPTVNQCPFNPYRSSSQMDTVNFCKAHDITFLAYSPLGIPDWHQFNPPLQKTVLEEPTIRQIAEAHGKTPAQVILNWEWNLGIPSNPRSMNATHMQENMGIYDWTLTAAEMKQMGAFHQDGCSIDGSFYECAPGL